MFLESTKIHVKSVKIHVGVNVGVKIHGGVKIYVKGVKLPRKCEFPRKLNLTFDLQI